MARMSREKTKRSKGEEGSGGRYGLLKLKNCSRLCSISCSLMAEKRKDIIFKEIQLHLLQLERNGSHLGGKKTLLQVCISELSLQAQWQNRKNMLFLLLNASQPHRPRSCEIISEFLSPTPRILENINTKALVRHAPVD